MKHIALLVFALIGGTASAAAIQVEVGVGHAEVSGLRRYAAKRFLRTSHTDSLTVPTVRVSSALHERINASLGYSYYGTLRGSGAAPSSDIFDEGGPALTVITPFSSSEKIHEGVVGVSYRFLREAPFRLEAGPEVSLFYSKATIASRSFSEVDVRLGGHVQVAYAVTERLAAKLGYRLVNPPSRTMHVFSVSLGYSL